MGQALKIHTDDCGDGTSYQGYELRMQLRKGSIDFVL